MPGPWAAPGKGRAGALEAAAPGQCGPEIRPYFQRRPYCGSEVGCSLPITLAVFPLPLTWGCRAPRAELVPRLASPGSHRRKKRGPQRGTGGRRPQPWVPGKTLLRRRGGASAARLCSPAEHAGTGRCHGDGCAAPRPAPLGVAGGPTGRGLSDPTARRRPRRDQDGGRRGRGAAGRAGSSGVCPLTAPSRGRGEERKWPRRLQSSCLRVWPDSYPP